MLQGPASPAVIAHQEQHKQLLILNYWIRNGIDSCCVRREKRANQSERDARSAVGPAPCNDSPFFRLYRDRYLDAIGHRITIYAFFMKCALKQNAYLKYKTHIYFLSKTPAAKRDEHRVLYSSTFAVYAAVVS